MHEDITLLRLLNRSREHEVACILLSNGFPDTYGKYDIVAGFGARSVINDLEGLHDRTFLMGFFAYDLKNKIEDLRSDNSAWNKIPDLFFFEPVEHYRKLRTGAVESNFGLDTDPAISAKDHHLKYNINWQKPEKENYLNTIENIRSEITNGVFYELNYCTEWKADDVDGFDPYRDFYRLNSLSPAPFAAFFKFGNKFLLCTSPERFLTISGNSIISQPIKGTRRRAADHHEDSLIRTELMTSEKDRAENVMITDLVRNDLSVFCEHGTVEVEELCGIHSFKHVHQMISTITGKMKAGTSLEKVIRSTFPMGSMTGAPKVKVMECIERFENFRRGWYSGSLGYIEPGRVDLNVVIRSLQFDAEEKRLSYHVGGAITFDSNAESEFQECLDKAAGIMSLFQEAPGNSNL